jgi:hypothetical protein
MPALEEFMPRAPSLPDTVAMQLYRAIAPPDVVSGVASRDGSDGGKEAEADAGEEEEEEEETGGGSDRDRDGSTASGAALRPADAHIVQVFMRDVFSKHAEGVSPDARVADTRRAVSASSATVLASPSQRVPALVLRAVAADPDSEM